MGASACLRGGELEHAAMSSVSETSASSILIFRFLSDASATPVFFSEHDPARFFYGTHATTDAELRFVGTGWGHLKHLFTTSLYCTTSAHSPETTNRSTICISLAWYLLENLSGNVILGQYSAESEFRR